MLSELINITSKRGGAVMTFCMILYNKTNYVDALISQIYSSNETLHVSESSSVNLPEFFTVHTTMVYVIHIP